jgi:hypothetical protein
MDKRNLDNTLRGHGILVVKKTTEEVTIPLCKIKNLQWTEYKKNISKVIGCIKSKITTITGRFERPISGAENQRLNH